VKTKIKIALLGLMILSLAACASPVRDLYFGEIAGTVVDADTNQPIEGAVVYANWQATDGTLSLIKTVDVGPLYVTETTTDKEGHYVLPKGGPIKVVKLDTLSSNAPTIGVIKDGYKVGISSAHHKVEYSGFINKHFLPGCPQCRNFKLHRLTLQEQLFGKDSYSTYSVSHDIADIMNRGGCWWEKLPMTILAFEQLYNKAKEQNFEFLSRIVTRSNIPRDRDCKDPEQVLGEIAK
jgi:hypothetical protein